MNSYVSAKIQPAKIVKIWIQRKNREIFIVTSLFFTIFAAQTTTWHVFCHKWFAQPKRLPFIRNTHY